MKTPDAAPAHVRAVDSIPNDRGCVQWCPACEAEAVRCDGLIVTLNEAGEMVDPRQCQNEAVYGLGVAFRNYCASCTPAKEAR